MPPAKSVLPPAPVQAVQDINKLCKQQQQMQTVMKKHQEDGHGQYDEADERPDGRQKADELEMMAQSMDPDGLAADMAAGEQGPLGPNPFDDIPQGSMGGSAPAGLPGLGGGMPGLAGMGGMPGMPTRGGSKKKRKPRPKKGKGKRR